MEKAVLFVKGNVTEKEVMRIVKGPPLTLPVRDGVVSYENCEADACSDHSAPSLTGRAGGGSPLHQSHVMLGARSYAMTDPRHIGIALLSNLLGGPAMSSRLSLALRERTGLVYTVESNVNAYTDTGVWSVYFGCDHADVQRCLRLVRRELHRLTDKPLSQRTLDAARRQIKGQMAIAADNSENAALSMAKLFLHTNRTYSLDDRFAQLDALTPDVLHAIACDVLDPDRLTTLVFQ